VTPGRRGSPARILAGSALLLASACGGGSELPPNVVLVSLDTLRPDHLSCYGYDRPTSPHLDRLAAQGHRFEWALTTMPTTLPAHASLMTSLYPSQLNVRRNSGTLPEEARTLAEALQEAGYATAAFVSAEPLHANHNLDQGFDLYRDAGEEGSLVADQTLRRAQRFLDESRSRPFFLFLHLFDPHTSYAAPPGARRRLGAPDRPMGANGFRAGARELPAEEVADTIRAYDAEIAYTDSAVGRLLERLDERGLADRTLVVIVSDHGESLDELIASHDYAFDHGEFLTLHQVRVALIVRQPGEASRPAGAVHPATVSLVDVAPTILDLLGLPPLATAAGRSLAPLLAGGALPPAPVFSERRSSAKAKAGVAQPEWSATEAPWHLILTPDGEELYDARTDPAGRTDVLARSAPPAELSRALELWRSRLQPLYAEVARPADPEALERLRALGYGE
jgi:arylsulfatase A-like enzyme